MAENKRNIKKSGIERVRLILTQGIFMCYSIPIKCRGGYFMTRTSTATLDLAGGTCFAATVNLPKTMLMTIMVPDVGYIMCGVLNVPAMDELHPEREIIAARVTGVRSYDDMLNARIQSVTKKGHKIGIETGMTGKDALGKMLAYRKTLGLEE